MDVLKFIKLIVYDLDGVMSDNKIYFESYYAGIKSISHAHLKSIPPKSHPS